MKKILIVLPMITLLFGGAQVFAYSSGAYSFAPGDPNYNAAATIYPGAIDSTDLIFGDFLGISAVQPNAPGYGDSGVSVGWDDTWVSGVGNPNTNGDALDGLWAQIVYPNEGWWDLGFPTNQVVVFLSQDHGPYLAEGLEVRVYGSNTLWGAVGAQAVLKKVYLDGWRTHDPAEDLNANGWCSDDIAAVFELDGNYQYVKIAAWSSTGGLDEPEVDAIAAFEYNVSVDIKPGSCPNPLNTKSKGGLPVAILGTADFDVNQIDPASVSIEGVSPLRWAWADVGTPYGAPVEDCLADCTEEYGDGIMDLIFNFDRQEIVAALGDIYDGDCLVLTLTGNLKEEFGGTPFVGEDVLLILKKGNN